MIHALTSIAPNRIEEQQRCVESWLRAGLRERPGHMGAQTSKRNRLTFHLMLRSDLRLTFGLPLSNREKLGMDQVFVVRTSKSGLNQPTVV